MKKIIALLFLCLATAYSFACSTFLLSKNGKHYFGRNYDWMTGTGMVMVNARGVAKNSFMPSDGKAISWVSGYGSITFNQFGKEFPHGGMNERGLVVELMWLSETSYPESDDRASINVLQWVQYQLDNCANIAEVLATDKKIRIDRVNAAPLHFLVADATGKAATIEFIDGKMVVHQGTDLNFPVLTNTPYNEAVKQVNNQKDAKGTFKDNSVERFATACKMVQQYQVTDVKEEPVDYAFNILNKVSQKNFTKWSIVYDITNKQIYFIANGETERKYLGLRDFNYSCSNAPLAFNLSDKRSGGISKEFSTLTFDDNKKLIQQSAKESASEVQVSESSQNRAANYFKLVSCRENGN
jgi:penicillin V acylase-like amidase (Ntn superfamily)